MSDKSAVETTAGRPVAWITGASDGIGRALALELARKGYRVAILARREAELKELAAAVAAEGSEALVIPADVSNLEELRAARDSIVEGFGRIDLAIANAGVGVLIKAVDPNLDGVRRTFGVNLEGAVNMLHLASEPMLERGSGHLVGVASLGALIGMPGMSAYGASKAALIYYLDSLRPELASRGVAVTAVMPGFIRTKMTAPNKFKMPFILEPEEAAKVIVKGIEKRKRVVAFPWQMHLFLRMAASMPRWLTDRFLGGGASKRR